MEQETLWHFVRRCVVTKTLPRIRVRERLFPKVSKRLRPLAARVFSAKAAGSRTRFCLERDVLRGEPCPSGGKPRWWPDLSCELLFATSSVCSPWLVGRLVGCPSLPESDGHLLAPRRGDAKDHNVHSRALLPEHCGNGFANTSTGSGYKSDSTR